MQAQKRKLFPPIQNTIKKAQPHSHATTTKQELDSNTTWQAQNNPQIPLDIVKIKEKSTQSVAAIQHIPIEYLNNNIPPTNGQRSIEMDLQKMQRKIIGMEYASPTQANKCKFSRLQLERSPAITKNKKQRYSCKNPILQRILSYYVTPCPAIITITKRYKDR